MNTPAAAQKAAAEMTNKMQEASQERKSIFEALMNEIEKINPSAPINIVIIEAKTNPITPKYVFTSNFLNKNSSNLDITIIPTKTPTPNGTKIIIFCHIFSNFVKALIVFTIGL